MIKLRSKVTIFCIKIEDMNFILGKKIRMTQIFAEDGQLIPVTEISVEPNTVIRVKGKEKDGYEAIVLASGTRNKIKRSLEGLFNKLGKFRYIKEFRTEGQEITLKTGDQIGLDSFQVGDKVKATAVSKGKGFQGVVKRHGFHGTNEQHGNKDQSRMPGSIGATGPAHVFKGTKMGGRMGGDQVTLTNLEIIKIDLDNNLLYLKGACAGGSNALVAIKGEGELKVYEKPIKEVKTEETEIPKEEIKSEEVKEEVSKEEFTPEVKKEEQVTEVKEEKKETPKEEKVEEVKKEVKSEETKEEVKK
jgi:large subunit ribosomal protein L3